LIDENVDQFINVFGYLLLTPISTIYNTRSILALFL
jgi:hypothetical protein